MSDTNNSSFPSGNTSDTFANNLQGGVNMSRSSSAASSANRPTNFQPGTYSSPSSNSLTRQHPSANTNPYSNPLYTESVLRHNGNPQLRRLQRASTRRSRENAPIPRSHPIQYAIPSTTEAARLDTPSLQPTRSRDANHIFPHNQRLGPNQYGASTSIGRPVPATNTLVRSSQQQSYGAEPYRQYGSSDSDYGHSLNSSTGSSHPNSDFQRNVSVPSLLQQSYGNLPSSHDASSNSDYDHSMSSSHGSFHQGHGNQYVGPSEYSDREQQSSNHADTDEDDNLDHFNSVEDDSWVIPEPVFDYNGDIDDIEAFCDARDSRKRVLRLDENFPGFVKQTRGHVVRIFNAFMQTDDVTDDLVREGSDATAVTWMKNGYWSSDVLWRASWKVVLDCYDLGAGATPGVTVYETKKKRDGTEYKVPRDSVLKKEYPNFWARFVETHRLLFHSKTACKNWLDAEVAPVQLRIVAAPESIEKTKRRNKSCNDRRKEKRKFQGPDNGQTGTREPPRKVARGSRNMATIRQPAKSRATRSNAVQNNGASGYPSSSGSRMNSSPYGMSRVSRTPSGFPTPERLTGNDEAFGPAPPNHYYQSDQRTAEYNRPSELRYQPAAAYQDNNSSDGQSFRSETNEPTFQQVAQMYPQRTFPVPRQVKGVENTRKSVPSSTEFHRNIAPSIRANTLTSNASSSLNQRPTNGGGGSGLANEDVGSTFSVRNTDNALAADNTLPMTSSIEGTSAESEVPFMTPEQLVSGLPNSTSEEPQAFQDSALQQSDPERVDSLATQASHTQSDIPPSVNPDTSIGTQASEIMADYNRNVEALAHQESNYSSVRDPFAAQSEDIGVQTEGDTQTASHGLANSTAGSQQLNQEGAPQSFDSTVEGRTQSSVDNTSTDLPQSQQNEGNAGSSTNTTVRKSYGAPIDESNSWGEDAWN